MKRKPVSGKTLKGKTSADLKPKPPSKKGKKGTPKRIPGMPF